MCDPISAGLIIAGTVAQGVAASDAASHEKHDIQSTEKQYSDYLNKSNDAFQAERTKQNDFFNQNTGTVADTLSKYSLPNQTQALQTAQAKRQSDYTAPINAMSFGAPGAANAAPNSAVANRNNAQASAAKATSLSEAIAKANADAYSDVNTQLAGQAETNANAIRQTNINATKQQAAGNVTQNNINQEAQNIQNLLPAKLAADANKGGLMRGIGQTLQMAGQLGAMSPGGMTGLIGNTGGVLVPSTVVNGVTLPAIPAIPGSGIAGGLSKIGNVFA